MDQTGSAAILSTKRPVGVAPEVNLRDLLHEGDKACKQWIQSDSETQGRCHQKSKIGASVVPQKGLVSSQKIKNEKKNCLQDIVLF